MMDISIRAQRAAFPATQPHVKMALTIRLLRASFGLFSLFSVLLLAALVFGHGLPRAGQIAFTSAKDANGEIFLADVERGIVQNITRSSVPDMLPVWSPDGAQIAYRLHLGDGGILGNIYLFNVSDGSHRNLTNYDAYYNVPVWSPDGRHLAFESNRDGDFEIYRLDLDCPSPCETNTYALTANEFRDYGPIWSPDGSTVVFLSYLDSGRTELHSVSAEGGSLHDLSYSTLPADQSLRWSPDGAHILLTLWDGFQSDIYRMDADCILREADTPPHCENSLRNLSHHTHDDWFPVWSPDSSQIIFLSNRDGGTEIYRLEINSDTLHRLTDNTVEDRDLAWSRDGQWIAFASNVDGDFEIFVMDVDGGNLQRVTYNDSVDFAPDWRPG
jgi:Tol biopolymer transport system component